MTANSFSIFIRTVRNTGRTHSSWCRALLLTLVAIGAVGSASAQIIYGSIVGAVTDGTGAVVPHATITVTQNATNLVRETKSDNGGGYKVSTLPAGEYTVVISGSGFGTETVTNVAVTANNDVRADAVLKVGATTMSIVVSDATQSLQTDRADVSTNLSAKEVGDLPIAGRNFQSLLSTVPGVLPPSDNVGQGSVNNPARSQTFQGNGSNGASSNVQIEGVSAANSWITNLSSYIPAEDSIQSVDIVTGSFNAEQGTAGGIAVNVQLKSGSNSFHGTAFEQYTSAYLTTKPRFNFASGGRNPQLVEHQFGGTIGGPILKNKLFFFASAERLSDHETQLNTFSVPTVSERQGYFRYTGPKTVVAGSGYTVPGNGLGLYDPATGNADGSGRTSFPLLTNPTGCVGCQAGQYYYVDPSRWSFPTKTFLAAIPTPNIGDNSTGFLTGNYKSLGKYTYGSTKIDGKLDYNFSEKLHLNYRLSLLPFKEVVPSAYCDQGAPCAAAGPPTTYIGQPGPTTGNVYSNSFSGIYTVSPKLVVDGNVGFTYLKTGVEPPLYGNPYCSDTLKVPNCDGPDPINTGVPQIAISGLNSSSGRAAPFGNWYSAIKNHNPNYTGQANVTWTKGSHSMRFGGNYSKVTLNIAEDLFGYGDLEFNGGATSSNGIANAFQRENSVADFLLGQAYRIQKRILNTTYSSLRTSAEYFYGQDQWQVSKKLTLNYGLRWNLYPVPHRAHSGIELFDPTALTPNLAGINYVCGRGSVASNCGINVSKRLFSPLVGFAYRLDEKTVFRAGGGINYNQDSMFRDGLENYPSQTGFNQANSNTYLPYENVMVGFPASINTHPDLTQPSYILPAGVTNAANLRPGDFKRGYTESWNVTFERQFGLGWTGQIAYVASQVVHGQALVNLNVSSAFGTTTIQNNTTGSGTCSVAGACTIQPVAAAPRAFQSTLGTNGYSVESPFLHSTYNSLQTTLRHNFSNGFLLTANYTWSRHIGTSGTPFVYLPYLSLNRQLQGDDRKHNFNVTLLGELPFGKNKPFLSSGIAAKIAGGWQINSITTATSGTPFTLSANAGFNSSGVGSNWADRLKQTSGKGTQTINPIDGSIINYLDNTAFGDPNTDCNTYNSVTRPYCPLRFGTGGNSFNALRGPKLLNVDFGLSRKFHIWESVSFKFTTDVFNLTNTPHLGNPNSNISSYNATIPNNFGRINATNPFGGRFGLDQRQIRLGGTFNF